METVRVSLPGGGDVEALRLQDLPAEHVASFVGLPYHLKPVAGAKLFSLATGSDTVLQGMTFGEMEHTLNTWFELSTESEENDPDGVGRGLDWSGLLR